METEIMKKTRLFITQKALELFSNVNESPSDDLLQERLIEPLEVIWRAGEIHQILQSNPTVANFCGKVFKNGEPAVFCKDCQTDPTCCLCLPCFENSEHKNHNYRMFASGGGGCCDCGDPEAWTSHVYCTLHQPSKDITDAEIDPIKNLPHSLSMDAQSFFTTVLLYCVQLLNWESGVELPSDWSDSKTHEILATDSFVAILMNDEVHSYDDVIKGLHKHLGLSNSDSVNLATLVDRKGRGFLCKGSKAECEKAALDVNTSLGHSPLEVRILHTAVLCHQNCAIYLLNFLKDLAEKSDGFCRLLSIVMATPTPGDPAHHCILDDFFLNDNSLWIEARLSWQKLIMSSIFKDFEYKKQLAISLVRNYLKLSRNFWKDTHNHDVCAINLTVQLFTVPSISRMLVGEHGALKVVIDTIRDLVARFWDNDANCLNFHSLHYKHDRIGYLLCDLRYLLRNRPDEMDEQMRDKTYEAFQSFVKLLSSMNNMDSVKRQHGSHVHMEPPWENSFNFSIILQTGLLLSLEWCLSDEIVLHEVVKIALTEHLKNKYKFKLHNVDKSLMTLGRSNHTELIMFDILKDPVSFHQPLVRFIGGLLTGASRYNISLISLLGEHNIDTCTLLSIMEPSSRSIVYSSQVINGMWKRNGYGVLNQAIHYQFQSSSEVMYKKDICLLQSVAAVMDPNVFLYALLYKFRLEEWLTKPDSKPSKRNERGEDAIRFLVTELEEFLFLIIAIFNERHTPGIGEGVVIEHTLERDLIHMLYFGPQPHSQLVKKFKLSDTESKVNAIIKKVANLKTISRKSLFELKEQFTDKYDPFYYQYSKIEQSQAEEVWRKQVKANGGFSKITSAPPCSPPSFTAPYQGVLNLLNSPVLIKIFINIFKSATTDGSKYWSVRLLHESLHLLALMLVEEERRGQHDFHKACLGATTAGIGILPYLEALRNTTHIEERQYLLNWIIKVLHSSNGCGSDANNDIEMVTEDEESVDSPSVNLKRQRAEAHRKQVMMRMAQMQKSFYTQHKDELDLIESEPVTPATDTNTDASVPHGGPAVGVAALLNHTPPCIKAKCILCQEETQDVAMETEQKFVLATCVQRSSVMRRKEREGEGENEKPDYLSGLLDIQWGIFTGGCGHVMHSTCWQKYIDNKKQEHSARRYFFAIPGHTILWQDGEFLCPLCETFGSTVLPLTTPLHCTVPSVRPTPTVVSLHVIEELLRAAVTRGEEIRLGELDSPVDLPEFNEKLRQLFPECCQYVAPLSICQSPVLNEMESLFSQSVFMQGYACLPDESNEDVPLAQWQNCSYTISALEHATRSEGKFLLDSVTIRQLDIIRSMIQFGWRVTDHLETKVLADYSNRMMNIFLPAMSAFSEQPSVVSMDVFSLMVNLHFTLSSLLNRLTTDKPHLPHYNTLIIPLVAMVDQYLVTMGTTVQIIQYLLCTPPAGMEEDMTPGDETTGSDPEVNEGRELQKLWSLVHTLAGGDSSCDTPPPPYSLYIGMQEHLYPFLQSLSLFFKCLTGIEFIHSSASMASNFIDLCAYLNLPNSLSSLFSQPAVSKLCQNLCSHPKLTDVVRCTTSHPSSSPSNPSSSPSNPSISHSNPSIPLAIQKTRQLATLPGRYSELIKMAAEFKCPNTAMDTEDSQTVMLCLLCGQLLCTNCYSCQVQPTDDEEFKIGGLTQHSQLCGAGLGMAIWIVECFVVLMDARDIHNVHGCTLTPPYIDEYGESDPGLRRGNPLNFNTDIYKDVQQIWLSHQLPERIHKEMEQNMKLVRIKWSLM